MTQFPSTKQYYSCVIHTKEKQTTNSLFLARDLVQFQEAYKDKVLLEVNLKLVQKIPFKLSFRVFRADNCVGGIRAGVT